MMKEKISVTTTQEHDDCRLALAINQAIAQVSDIKVPKYAVTASGERAFLIRWETTTEKKSKQVHACCTLRAKADLLASLLFSN